MERRETVLALDSEWCVESDYYLACLYSPNLGLEKTCTTREEVRYWLDQLPDVPVVGHNIRSDFTTLGYYPPNPIYNTGTLAWLYNENGAHGLKPLSEAMLNRPLEDPISMRGRATYFKQGKRYVPIAEANQETVEQYCQEDTRATHDLYFLLRPLLGDREWAWYTEVEEPMDRLLYRMERTGVLVDTEALGAAAYELRQRAESLREKLFAEVGYEFNPGSSPQVAKVLFTKEWTTKVKREVGTYKTGRPIVRWVEEPRPGLGLRPTKKTKGGGTSTDDEALQDLRVHPTVNLLLDWRETDKLVGTYLGSWPSFIGEDDRIRGRFNSIGTLTGRFSSSDPNLQNIPARGELGKKLRRLFIAGPGNVLVGGDLDQVELRLLAGMSGCESLIQAFLSGRDVHQETADRMSVSRSLAKNINYTLAYMGTAKTCWTKYARNQTLEFVEDAFELHRRTFPEIYDWQDRVIAFARQHQAVVMLGKRVRHLPGINSSNKWDRLRAERQAVNSVIQGSAATIQKVWMLEVQHLNLLLTVHDELVAECKAEEGPVYVREMIEGLARTTARFPLKVPITVSPKIMSNWGESK